MAAYRKCPKCAKLKELDKFGYRDMGWSGFKVQSYCKPCRRVKKQHAVKELKVDAYELRNVVKQHYYETFQDKAKSRSIQFMQDKLKRRGIRIVIDV